MENLQPKNFSRKLLSRLHKRIMYKVVHTIHHLEMLKILRVGCRPRTLASSFRSPNLTDKFASLAARGPTREQQEELKREKEKLRGHL